MEDLSPLLHPDALVAINTSCLRVGDLARHITRPERFLGLHYFSPAAVNPIVEVVMCGATATATVETALDFCRLSGKQPLSRQDSYGFAVNRFFCPYTNEAARALDEGLGTTGEIDAEALRFGLGPCALMDRLGRAEVARIIAPALAAFGVAPPSALSRVGTLGR